MSFAVDMISIAEDVGTLSVPITLKASSIEADIRFSLTAVSGSASECSLSTLRLSLV